MCVVMGGNWNSRESFRPRMPVYFRRIQENHVLKSDRILNIFIKLKSEKHALEVMWLSGWNFRHPGQIQLDGESHTHLIEGHVKNRLIRERGSQLDRDALMIQANLPRNIGNFTEETIIAMGRIDIFTSSWPRADLHRVNEMTTLGRGEQRTGPFLQMERILTWVLRHNPHCHYMFGNIDFQEDFPEAWETANRRLGAPVVWDVARISLA
jgi:hypothetical protein